MKKSNFRRSENVVAIVQVFLALLMCSVAWPGEISNDDPSKKIDIKKAVGELARAWANDAVARLVVLHIPTNRYYPVSVSTGQIEAHPAYSLAIEDAKSSEIAKQFMTTLGKLKLTPANQVADLRWGLIFCEHNNDRILSIYCDATGQRGVLNGACVDFSSDAMKSLMEKHFSTAFR
jgi:hypothetical protein